MGGFVILSAIGNIRVEDLVILVQQEIFQGSFSNSYGNRKYSQGSLSLRTIVNVLMGVLVILRAIGNIPVGVLVILEQ